MRGIGSAASFVSYQVQQAPSLIRAGRPDCTANPKFLGRPLHTCGALTDAQVWQSQHATSATAQLEMEVRVCTNRTCLKDGSLDVLQYFQDMAPPNLTVETCGCLGRCGAGPTVVLLPQELLVSHLETPSQVAKLLERQAGAGDPETNLHALALKNQGKAAFGKGQLDSAEDLFTQAIDLRPSGGLHLLYSNRAAVRTAQANFAGALEDARSAAELAPRWAVPLMRMGETHAAAGDAAQAVAAYTRAAQMDLSLRKSKSFQRKMNEARGKLAVTK